VGARSPFPLPRLDHGWSVRPEGPAASLRFIVEELGAARVMMGSDYPFDLGATDPVGFLAGAGLDDATRSAIEGGNASRFLR
jgi:aminocarboxymuconate-semialdehyde decarboxylase